MSATKIVSIKVVREQLDNYHLGNFPDLYDEQITKILPAMGKNINEQVIGIACGRKRVYVPVIELVKKYENLLMEWDGYYYLDTANISLTCHGSYWSIQPAGKQSDYLQP
jgi:hypothetical protein